MSSSWCSLPPANEVWGKVVFLQVSVCPQGGGLSMMSLPVWLTGPMLLGGLSLAPCSFQGVSASSPMLLPGGGLPNLNLPEETPLHTPVR